MDRLHRLDRLLALLGAQQEHLEHLKAHQERLLTHHVSRERDRLLLQGKKSMRRADKAVRSLERAVRNARKQNAP